MDTVAERIKNPNQLLQEPATDAIALEVLGFRKQNKNCGDLKPTRTKKRPNSKEIVAKPTATIKITKKKEAFCQLQ